MPTSYACFPKTNISFPDIETLIHLLMRTKTDNIQPYLVRFKILADSFNFSDVQILFFMERYLKCRTTFCTK